MSTEQDADAAWDRAITAVVNGTMLSTITHVPITTRAGVQDAIVEVLVCLIAGGVNSVGSFEAVLDLIRNHPKRAKIEARFAMQDARIEAFEAAMKGQLQ